MRNALILMDSSRANASGLTLLLMVLLALFEIWQKWKIFPVA
jgi:hypothetical protein